MKRALALLLCWPSFAMAAEGNDLVTVAEGTALFCGKRVVAVMNDGMGNLLANSGGGPTGQIGLTVDKEKTKATGSWKPSEGDILFDSLWQSVEVELFSEKNNLNIRLMAAVKDKNGDDELFKSVTKKIPAKFIADLKNPNGKKRAKFSLGGLSIVNPKAKLLIGAESEEAEAKLIHELGLKEHDLVKFEFNDCYLEARAKTDD